jgi:hypothetical protein
VTRNQEGIYFLPYAEMLLHQLALETPVLVMDGSVVGRGCCALMIHVVYRGRALPLAWQVREGPKGHFPESFPIYLVDITEVGTLSRKRIEDPKAPVSVLGCHRVGSWQRYTRVALPNSPAPLCGPLWKPGGLDICLKKSMRA